MKKRLTTLLLAALFLALPLFAVLGVGDIVFDPTSYANALVMLAELVDSYEQLKAQFNLQSFLATVVPVDMSSRYRTPGVTWQPLQVPYDRFGNLGPWVQNVNQGGSAQAAYSGATIELQSYGSGYANLAAEEQRNTASQYASIELIDGNNIDAMQTIGQLRANSRVTDQALAGLESDSLSSDPSLNSEIGVLNKISAAAVASLRVNRDANRVILSALEQQLAASKRARDAEVAEINAQIARLANGPGAKAQYTSTITGTLTGFRWQ